MKKSTNKRGLALSSSKGFTLIEVVLVLAIGGLIFLLAFVAFQQVSANRRDTQRRSDAGRVIAELQNYYTDKGVYPSDAAGAGWTPSEFATFMGAYLSGIKDPQGYTYGQKITDADFNNAATPEVNFFGSFWPIQYGRGKKCSGTNFVDNPGGVAVRIKLEKGIICRDA